MPGNAFGLMIRTSCTVCGGPIEWLELSALEGDPEFQEMLSEVASVGLGPVESVWQCRAAKCAERGIFFGTEAF